jgi:hypothetical protein
MQGIMDAQHEGQQVAAPADVRYRPGQRGTASTDRVSSIWPWKTVS